MTSHEDGNPSKGAFRDALRLLLAGNTAAGLARYDEGLRRARNPATVPAGLHVRLLEQAGRTSEADSVRRLALAGGADLALKAATIGADPAEAACEYERLIAAGTVNSQMIHEYLLVLSRLGRVADVAALLDPERLLRRVKIDPPVAGRGAGGLAAAVGELLLEEESRGTYREVHQ